jgi:hypothetical protein
LEKIFLYWPRLLRWAMWPMGLLFFYALEIKDQGAYCFCPVCHSVLLLFCHSVLLSSAKNFNLGYNFWMVSTKILIFHMSIFMGTKIFDLLTLTLVFDLLIENVNLGYIFWLVGTRALTYCMSFPCAKTFLRVPKTWLCDLNLGVKPTY